VAARDSFPQEFLWGAATAAYQVEGAVDVGGRGTSIWDTFSHSPGRTRNGDTGDVACQHYARLDEDLDLIAALGIKSYRFSISWPRVQPDGKGPANQEGLDFYRRLVTGLRDRGVVPAATLYHWDLPQPLEDQGGWANRDTADRFGEYTSLMADALSDQMGMWITLNEPWCSAWLGYATGDHAPGRADVSDGLAANHHLLLAHARGAEVLRAAGQTVGITLNLSRSIPASDHELDVAAAHRAEGALNRMYLGPLFKGAFPADLVELFSSHKPGLDVAQEGDMEAISRPIDFLGVNYYETRVIADPSRLDAARQAGFHVPADGPTGASALLKAQAVGRPQATRTATEWEVDPSGLTYVLTHVKDNYTSVPLYVTENGCAQHDYQGPDGAVHDAGRIEYLAQHFRAALDAMAQGVDLRGYFVWSLMDNFEWALGYSMRFGLTWVDYPSGRRVPKDSYRWYQEVIANNGLS
jgi:beta-glucosidase